MTDSLFQKPISDTRTLILCPSQKREALSATRIQEKVEEARGLALSLGLRVVQSFPVLLSRITPATYLGQGKVEAYQATVNEEQIDLVIVDIALSPVQQRNLEEAWNTKVIDRTALILEIFAARAQSREGKLQVRLAALEYQKGRLVRSWTHLERQRGGLGTVGGPGETQIEVDRRIIGEEIHRIKQELEKVKRTRGLHRSARAKVPYPVVALVGYTNAGKSTLFNRLTGAKVHAADQLFATLDPTLRSVILPSKRTMILSDTVGFISDLPTELVASFRATLEEVCQADIILHVRDISHPATHQQKEDVEQILRSLDLEEALHTRLIEVLNKIDRVPGDPPPMQRSGEKVTLGISALTGSHCDTLLAVIDQMLEGDERTVQLRLSVTEGQILAWLHAHATILEQEGEDTWMILKVRLPGLAYHRLEQMVKESGCVIEEVNEK